MLSVVFWAGFVADLALILPSKVGLTDTLVYLALMAVAAVLWPRLPWSQQASFWCKLGAPLLLVVSLVLGSNMSWLSGVFGMLALSSIAFQYGSRVAWPVVGGYALLVFLSVTLLVGRPLLAGLLQGLGAVFIAAFVLGMTSAIQEARDRREAADHLNRRIRELVVAEERARMARDMHDSIGHHLTVIKMGLENAERFKTHRPDAVWDEIAQAKEMTVRALADARRWVRALRPLDLNGNLGSAALGQLAQSFAGTDLRVSFEVSGDERPLDPDAELILYRVLQEGLTNAVRHSEATKVRARLSFEERKVVLVVGDDGKGADADAYGFGLASLRERVRVVGGSLCSGTASGGGFELRAEVPVGAI
ncbi:sensor histidine kinase [Nonomuraea longicatena]|uniref:histidine kinase n=1 Tax=Nonomuraea longicatena TaxID=83682 RepID=A0ABN1NTG4_9ACTN